MTSASQVFARTAKGDLESTGSTRLSAGLIKILRLVDGNSSVAELSSLAGISRSLLETTLEILVEDGMVKLSGRKDLVPPDRNRQPEAKAQSRNQSEPQDQNLAPANDFLGQMMREVQHGLAARKPDAAAPSTPPPKSLTKVSEPPAVPVVQSDPNAASKGAPLKNTEAQSKEQDVAWRKAEMAAKPGAERYAKLKADAQTKTEARETEFLAAAANAEELAVAKAKSEQEATLRAQAEAQAKEAQHKRLALEEEARLKAEAAAQAKDEELRGLVLEAEARAQAAADEARLKADAEARMREVELRRRADDEARLKAVAEARAAAEHQARLKAEAAAQAKEEELKRLAAEAETRARDEKAALEAEYQARLKAREEHQVRLDAEAKAKAHEEEARLQAEAEARAEDEERQRLAAEAEARAKEKEAARIVAQAEHQARMKAAEASRAEAEFIAAEEARIEQAIEARVKGSKANAAYDQYGLPDLPTESDEVAALSESRLNSPIEPPAREAQEPFPSADFEDQPAPIPQRQGEAVQPSGFSPAQRALKSPSWDSKIDAISQVRVRRHGAAIPWGKIVAASLLVVVVALGALRLFPQTQLRQEAERMLTESLGVPVSISAATVELFPAPLVRFENVTIGEPAIIRVGAIKATPDTSAWLNGTKSFRAAQLGAVSFTPESYPRIFELLLAARTRLKLPVRQIVISEMNVPPNGLGLNGVASELELMREGGLRKIFFTAKDSAMTVELIPQDSHFELTLSAPTWRLPGTDVDLESLNAAGQLKNNEFVITNFNGRAYGGRIEGKGTLRWGDRWRMNGTFKADGLNIERFPGAAVVSQGKLDLNGRFEAAADDSVSLHSRLKVGGKFSLQGGKLSGIDMARAIAESPKDVFGGMTPFKTLDGVFQSNAGSLELRDMRLVGGSLSASGQARLSASKELSGRLSATLVISPRRMHETLYLSGSATSPRIRTEK